MRCVVYDPHDLEALTVIEVPQVFIRELESGKRGPMLSFAIWADVIREPSQLATNECVSDMRRADVRMEQFRYHGASTWVAMALNPEICLLMRSTLLPGQRKDDADRQRQAFIRGLIAAFGMGEE